ncbi:MAG TPA: HipA domain-containing protein [Acidimicrobiia bacterium]|nr:HipA domain-containing protein [Acidimicrobiia bacterium]
MSPVAPDELRFVGAADVFKGGRLAARLVRESAAVRFQYFADYLEVAATVPVATTLPLSEEPMHTRSPGAVPPFFAGLLPEGRRLSALRRAVKTSADDDLTLLLAVGSDTIGDVQVVPVGETPDPAAVAVETADFSELRFADLYADMTGERLVPARAGIPGVQVKASARMISLPVRRAHERYLLKLDPPEYRHLVENEAFFLAAARASGLRAAQAEIVHDATGRAGLLVHRFDRIDADGASLMLAQEDACQVLGRYPADKYRLPAAEVVAGLAGVTGAPVVAARELVRQLAFAYVTANGDAHAKNFSVLRDPDGEWRVSPAYDVPSSHPYGDHSMALRINGKIDESIGRADFVALGESIGVRPRATERVLAELTERVDTWLPALAELPFEERTVHRLRRTIEYRRARLA